MFAIVLSISYSRNSGSSSKEGIICCFLNENDSVRGDLCISMDRKTELYIISSWNRKKWKMGLLFALRALKLSYAVYAVLL